MFAALAPENNSKLVTMARLGWRDVNGGVPIEESVRHEHKSRVFGGHNRIILDADVVGQSEAMPQGHVGISDLTLKPI